MIGTRDRDIRWQGYADLRTEPQVTEHVHVLWETMS